MTIGSKLNGIVLKKSTMNRVWTQLSIMEKIWEENASEKQKSENQCTK